MRAFLIQSALSGLALLGARALFSGRSIRARSRLPFGLFFAPAIWIAWVLAQAPGA